MKADPAVTKEWLEWTVTRLAAEAPENCLPGFPGLTAFDPPLVGFADGDDPLFRVFSEAVDARHLQPRAFLRSCFPRKPEAARLSVIAWALPFSPGVRESNREGEWPSPLYSLARNRGQAVIRGMSRHLVSLLGSRGVTTAAPALSTAYDIFHSAAFTYSSTWSERHVAYAAGLGRFGLNGSLITPRGSHVRLGSLVAGLALDLPASGPEGFRAPCFESRGTLCRRCIDRCPVGAVTPEGLNKKTCNARRKAIRERSLPSLQKKHPLKRFRLSIDGTRRWSYPLGCALCQCGVPCEGREPFPATLKQHA
jgi:epoxyqueuosine reductase QueG